MRVGIGYDVHTFTEGRKLYLGGVEIPHSLGLFGHSDADVLLHAICDAVLGALARGDIGKHFPDTDPRYHNISSLRLLSAVSDILLSEDYSIANIDSIVVAQAPRLAPFIPQMVKNIAATLNLKEDQVNVKATTTEGLGFVGKKEGIAAYAVVLITRKKA